MNRDYYLRTLILSCQCVEGKHEWCWGCTPLVSRLSSDHGKYYDNRLFLKICFLNKHHAPPDKESAAEEYTLNSAVFFLVRKFYTLRCLFGVLYVDMRCFGVSWVFSKHKIPHPNQWGSMKNHKEILFIQWRLQRSRFYLYTGSERSAFQCAPILLARWQNAG